MTYTIDIKKFFSLLPVPTLKDIAQRHNVQTGIKAPSQMLKAELVKSLSDHYNNLVGTNLIALPSKGLSIPYNEIPLKYKPKRELPPPKTKNPEELEKYQKQLELEKWARSFIKVTPTKKQLQEEQKAKKYQTDKKLQESIKKREARQAKQKAYREKIKKEGKTETKKEPKKAKQDEDEEITSTNKHVIEMQEILKNFEKLKKMPKSRAGQELYKITYNRYRNVEEAIKKDKNISAEDRKIINKLDKLIYTLSEDDEIIEKHFTF